MQAPRRCAAVAGGTVEPIPSSARCLCFTLILPRVAKIASFGMLSGYGFRVAAAPSVGSAFAALGARLHGAVPSTAAVTQQASFASPKDDAANQPPASRRAAACRLTQPLHAPVQHERSCQCLPSHRGWVQLLLPAAAILQPQQQQPQTAASSGSSAEAEEPTAHKTVGKADPNDAFIFKANCRGKREMSEDAKQTAEM